MNLPLFHASDVPQTARTPDELILITAQLLVDKHLATASFNTKLATVRQQNPGIAIMPMPTMTTVLTVSVGGAMDVQVPSGAKLARFVGINGQYLLVSRLGNAQGVLPASGAQPDATTGSFTPNAMYYYHVEEVQAISVTTSVSNTQVSIEWYAQL